MSKLIAGARTKLAPCVWLTSNSFYVRMFPCRARGNCVGITRPPACIDTAAFAADRTAIGSVRTCSPRFREKRTRELLFSLNSFRNGGGETELTAISIDQR